MAKVRYQNTEMWIKSNRNPCYMPQTDVVHFGGRITNKLCGSRRVRPTRYSPARVQCNNPTFHTSQVSTNFGVSVPFCSRLGQYLSDASSDHATLTFDFVGHGACRWYGSSYSICMPSLKFYIILHYKINLWYAKYKKCLTAKYIVHLKCTVK